MWSAGNDSHFLRAVPLLYCFSVGLSFLHMLLIHEWRIKTSGIALTGSENRCQGVSDVSAPLRQAQCFRSQRSLLVGHQKVSECQALAPTLPRVRASAYHL